MKLLLPFGLIAMIALASCDNEHVPDYDIRDEYVGIYDVTDACDASMSDYTLEVIYGSDYDEVVFSWPGLYEAGFEVAGIITGMKMIIPLQQFYVSSYPEIFYEFSGSASMEDGILRVDYTVLVVQNGLIIDENNCIATLVRR